MMRERSVCTRVVENSSMAATSPWTPTISMYSPTRNGLVKMIVSPATRAPSTWNPYRIARSRINCFAGMKPSFHSEGSKRNPDASWPGSGSRHLTGTGSPPWLACRRRPRRSGADRGPAPSGTHTPERSALRERRSPLREDFLEQVGRAGRGIGADLPLLLAHDVEEPVQGLSHHVPVEVEGLGPREG